MASDNMLKFTYVNQQLIRHAIQTMASYNLNEKSMCYRVKMQYTCVCVSPHVAIHMHPFLGISLLQTCSF